MKIYNYIRTSILLLNFSNTVFYFKEQRTEYKKTKNSMEEEVGTIRFASTRI